MAYTVKKRCSRCGGSGEIERNTAESPDYIDGFENTECPNCGGDGFINFGKVNLSDIDDKLDDILDKCNDIFEKVNE